MDASSVNEDYIELVLNGNFVNDYQKTINKVKNSNAIYKGKSIPFLYHPMFFTDKDINNFHQISKMIMSIGNKVVKEYINSPSYRLKFGFSPLLDELIIKEHGYKTNIPMGRFDLFYNGHDFMFCEFNTDGSSAMNEDNTLARIFLDTEVINKMNETFNIDYLECFDSWVEESLKLYEEYSKGKNKPTVAIVDFTESGTTAEFIEFRKAYEKKGIKTFICDVRDFKYFNGKLYYENNKIDLVYRRVVTKELIDRYNEALDFIEAIKDQAVCVIGPLKSQLLHNKIIFKILHDEDTLQLLNDEEKQFVKKHIPKTNKFSGGYEIFKEVLENKDCYIIKPCDLYGSRGVYVGLDFNHNQWEEILKTCFNNDYLYQEYFHPFERDFIEFDDKQIKLSPFKYITGLFIYNEKFTGLYTRIGKNHIISGIHGYYTIPNLIVKRGDNK